MEKGGVRFYRDSGYHNQSRVYLPRHTTQDTKKRVQVECWTDEKLFIHQYKEEHDYKLRTTEHAREPMSKISVHGGGLGRGGPAWVPRLSGGWSSAELVEAASQPEDESLSICSGPMWPGFGETVTVQHFSTGFCWKKSLMVCWPGIHPAVFFTGSISTGIRRTEFWKVKHPWVNNLACKCNVRQKPMTCIFMGYTTILHTHDRAYHVSLNVSWWYTCRPTWQTLRCVYLFM